MVLLTEKPTINAKLLKLIYKNTYPPKPVQATNIKIYELGCQFWLPTMCPDEIDPLRRVLSHFSFPFDDYLV